MRSNNQKKQGGVPEIGDPGVSYAQVLTSPETNGLGGWAVPDFSDTPSVGITHFHDLSNILIICVSGSFYSMFQYFSSINIFQVALYHYISGVTISSHFSDYEHCHGGQGSVKIIGGFQPSLLTGGEAIVNI